MQNQLHLKPANDRFSSWKGTHSQGTFALPIRLLSLFHKTSTQNSLTMKKKFSQQWLNHCQSLLIIQADLSILPCFFPFWRAFAKFRRALSGNRFKVVARLFIFQGVAALVKVLEATDFKKLEDNVLQLIKRFAASDYPFVKEQAAILIAAVLSKSSKSF